MDACSYFKHSRLIYLVYLYQSGIKKDFNLDLIHTDSWLQFSLTHVLQGDLSVEYVLYDGLLMENGLLFEYYLNDNLLGQPFLVASNPMSLITDQSKWANLFAGWDRFSVRVTAFIKPKYDEVHFFSSTITNNFELWVDNQPVLVDGAATGSIRLHRNSWAYIEMKWRVSNYSGMAP